jgi:MoaA/NifB/PqqE/SkfB family radical SAM enzyme
MTMTQRVDLKLGFSCNNRCTFCVQGDKRDQHPDRSTAELLALLEEARTHADQIVFTGGEVTIRQDLEELVAHARDLGFTVIQLQTNGRMLAVERRLDALIVAGVTEFSPAVHGHDATTHDGQTRAPGSFRQTVKGIRNVKARGFPVLTNTVITQQNYRHLPDIARLLVGLHVDQFQLAMVHPLGTAGRDFEAVVPAFRDLVPFVCEALRVGRAANVTAMTEAIPLCFLPGLEQHAAESRIPETRIVDAEQVIEDYTTARQVEGKAKGEPCQQCARNAECEGPWREYPEHYGWAGFVPLGVGGHWVSDPKRMHG